MSDDEQAKALAEIRKTLTEIAETQRKILAFQEIQTGVTYGKSMGIALGIALSLFAPVLAYFAIYRNH